MRFYFHYSILLFSGSVVASPSTPVRAQVHVGASQPSAAAVSSPNVGCVLVFIYLFFGPLGKKKKLAHCCK